MLNVQAMTQTMSAMSLPQLQQYAAMHKNDPYTVALALSIANQKKQAMTAQQGQAGMHPMPKVVDQALEQMAPRAAPMPEEVGIGQLPAPNIAKMAGGGIVAFGDGGEIPRYQGMGPSLVRDPQANSLTGDIPGFESGSILATAKAKYAAGQPLSSVEKALLFSSMPLAAGADLVALPFTGAANLIRNPLDKSPRPSLTPALDARSKALYGDQPAASAKMPDQTAAETARLFAANANAAPQPTRSSDTASFTPTPTPPNQTATNPYAITSPSFKPGEGLGLASSPTTLRSELDAFMPQGQAKSPFEAQIRAAGQKELEGEEAYKTKREQQIKDLGVYGADQETRLRAREEKLKGQESELGPLALLQAGFAMMSGSSPFALQNIGIGAQTGLKHYAEGTERLQNAKEKLDDAYGRLETARRSEKMLTQKELAELERNVNKVKTQTEKEVLNAAQQAYGMDRGDARTLFQAYADQAKTRAELVSRERLGLAQIGAQERIAGQRNQLMQDLYGGENKARAEYGKLQKQVMADLSKNMLYVNEPNENKKQAMFNAEMQRAMQANPFLSSYAAGVGFTKAPPAGKIFDLTE